MLDAHIRLCEGRPDIITILAPRHPHRGDEIAALATARGLGVARRSTGALPDPATAIYLADTLGDMGTLYATAPITFLAGSLVPVGGHNPIEPAHAGTALLLGPLMPNNRDAADALLAAGAARPVDDAGSIAAAVADLLADPGAARAMAAAARRVAADGRHGLDRIVDALTPMLPAAAPGRRHEGPWLLADGRAAAAPAVAGLGGLDRGRAGAPRDVGAVPAVGAADLRRQRGRRRHRQDPGGAGARRRHQVARAPSRVPVARLWRPGTGAAAGRPARSTTPAPSATSRCCWRGRRPPSSPATGRPAPGLLESEGVEVIIMDDGLQNTSLAPTAALLVVDGGAGFGNGRVMPAGPLREPLADALARVDAVAVIGRDRAGVEAAVGGSRPIVRAHLEPLPGTERFAGTRVLAFAGIGRPSKFAESLTEAGAEVVELAGFPDHHRWRPEEVMALVERAQALGATPVTTEKDAVRLPRASVGDGAGVSDRPGLAGSGADHPLDPPHPAPADAGGRRTDLTAACR